MKNITKQVVILDNFSSPYIYQAILILKDYNPALEDKVIEDAEKIVSAYLQHPQIYVKKRRSQAPAIIISCLAAAVLAAVLTYII